jgi:hypothetical protein
MKITLKIIIFYMLIILTSCSQETSTKKEKSNGKIKVTIVNAGAPDSTFFHFTIVKYGESINTNNYIATGDGQIYSGTGSGYIEDSNNNPIIFKGGEEYTLYGYVDLAPANSDMIPHNPDKVFPNNLNIMIDNDVNLNLDYNNFTVSTTP